MPRRAEIKTGKSGALQVARNLIYTWMQFHSTLDAAMQTMAERPPLKGSQASGEREQGSLSQGSQESGCKDGTQRPIRRHGNVLRQVSFLHFASGTSEASCSGGAISFGGCS